MSTFNYYCSNYGKVLDADKEGWWIAFDTESQDHGAIYISSEYLEESGGKITSTEQAQKILELIMDWEWDNSLEYFYAKVNHYGFNSTQIKDKQ